MRIRCNLCGAVVSTEVSNNTVVRGWVECAECVRPFPINQPSSEYKTTISWWVAKKVYKGYSKEYGTTQSLERMGERGGFSEAEMDRFYPEWRE